MLSIIMIAYFLKMTRLYKEIKINSFTLYYESWSIMETRILNEKGEVATIKDIIDGIKEMERIKGYTGYFIREIDSIHRCFKLQELMEVEEKRLHKLDWIRPDDPRFICIIDYIDTRKDTIAFTPFGMYFN